MRHKEEKLPISQSSMTKHFLAPTTGHKSLTYKSNVTQSFTLHFIF